MELATARALSRDKRARHVGIYTALVPGGKWAGSVLWHRDRNSVENEVCMTVPCFHLSSTKSESGPPALSVRPSRSASPSSERNRSASASVRAACHTSKSLVFSLLSLSLCSSSLELSSQTQCATWYHVEKLLLTSFLPHLIQVAIFERTHKHRLTHVRATGTATC